MNSTGRVEFKIDGIAYYLRADFYLISKMEQEMQTSVLRLTQQLSDESITVTQLANIICYCTDNMAQRGFIQSAVITEGLSSAIDAVTRLFLMLWAGRAAQDIHGDSMISELASLRRRFPD